MPVELSVVLASGDISSCRIAGTTVEDEVLTSQRLQNGRDTLDAALSTTTAFPTTEAGIVFDRVDVASTNLLIVDTAWGIQTGFQLINRAYDLSIEFNGFVDSTGSDKNIGIFIQQFPHDGTDINDPAQWVTEAYYLTTTGVVVGTVLFGDSYPYEEAGTVFAVTIVRGSGGGAANLAAGTYFGRVVDAANIKINSIVLPVI